MAGLPESFVRTVLAVEDAAALLAEARRTNSVALARDGAALGGGCAQLVIEAAEILAMLGEAAEARALLKDGLRLDGPTAPLQHAYARHCLGAGDLDEAARWLRGAMLRARPNAAMALELCAVEYARRDRAAARDALTLSVRLRWLDPDGLRTVYRSLADTGHGAAAIVPAMMLHRRGAGDPALRRALAGLLQAHAPYEDLPAEVIVGLRLDDPMTAIRAAAAAAHDELLAGFDLPGVISAARAREASGRWVGEAALWDHLKARIDRREPFSFVRMSDGEGRFVAALQPSLFPWFRAGEARAVLRQIWMNWFGQEVDEVPAEALRGLAAMFERAMRHAGVVGRTSAATYQHDMLHFGYRAALDRWFDGQAPAAGQHDSEAAYTVFLNRRDPFFAGLLSGQGFIGAISPYDDLARRLGERIGAADHRDYTIPGETRLGREQERANRGTHFPTVFDHMLREIEVPFPGACFVVAGGLLGKIYCERIRELGGIALDIGALADAWMGHDTRGNGFVQHVPDRLI